MYYGTTAGLNEAAKPSLDDGISSSATLISHMIKFCDENQKRKQTGSWVETILRDNTHLIQNENNAGNGRTNYINGIKAEYNGKVLIKVNTKLRDDHTGIVISVIPDMFCYENITNRNFVIKFLLQYVYTEDALSSIENSKFNIEIPVEVYKRCKGH